MCKVKFIDTHVLKFFIKWNYVYLQEDVGTYFSFLQSHIAKYEYHVHYRASQQQQKWKICLRLTWLFVLDIWWHSVIPLLFVIFYAFFCVKKDRKQEAQETEIGRRFHAIKGQFHSTFFGRRFGQIGCWFRRSEELKFELMMISGANFTIFEPQFSLWQYKPNTFSEERLEI